MAQHWRCARTRGRGGGCEGFRAPPSFGRQLEARQRAGRRAASESTVVDAPLATGSCIADPATPTGCECGLKSPGLHLRPHFFGDVTFFYTVTAPPRPAPPAPSLRSAACTALPLPRRLTPRRLTWHRLARRRLGLARLRLAPRRLVRDTVRPCLRPAPPCEDITKCRVSRTTLYSLVCTGPLPAAYRYFPS